MIQVLAELRGLHIVGVASERCIAPSGIYGILASVPQPAHPGEMKVLDPRGLEAARQIFLAKLRVAPGSWNGSHIHQPADAIGLQNADEFLDGMSGMPDCADDHVPDVPSSKVPKARIGFPREPVRVMQGYECES